ncbi:MAG: ABC transporter ATP-binding protein [Nevskiales bacterium]
MLALKNLCVAYDGKTVVHDISVELGEAEVLSLVGPTGCGKSTVLRTVAGLETPQSGEIIIGDLHISKDRPVPPEKRRTGLVFQDFALFPHLNVEQNIGFKLDNRQAAERWMQMLGLTPFRHAKPQTLSGGQKQRVALARALAHEPALLLLDEPLSNLDAALKSSLRWEIRDVLKTAGVAAIWVTHDQEEAMSIGDRVGVMRDGRLEQLGEPESCFRDPVNRFVAGFLGEAAFVPGILQAGQVETKLGTFQASSHNGQSGEVDVLLRPNDLAISAAQAGNARIVWGHYEGGTRLYAVRLVDGPEVRVRVNHELELAENDSVELRIVSGHPLSVFTRP